MAFVISRQFRAVADSSARYAEPDREHHFDEHDRDEEIDERAAVMVVVSDFRFDENL